MKTQLFSIISILVIISVTLMFHSTVNGRTIMNEKEWPKDVKREDDYRQLERRQSPVTTISSPAPTGSSITAAGSTSPTSALTGISTSPNTASTSNETSSSTISSTTATISTSITTPTSTIATTVIPPVIGPDYYPDYDFNTHLDYVYPM